LSQKQWLKAVPPGAVDYVSHPHDVSETVRGGKIENHGMRRLRAATQMPLFLEGRF
jgi:hypothetical protein